MDSALTEHDAAFDKWYAATATRRSRRAFDGEPVAEDLLDRLAEVCEGFRPFGDARVVLVSRPSSDVFTGIVGAYGKVTGAPHVIAVIADDSEPDSQQHAGYAGEAAVLEATALGLDTCWIGGFFDAHKVARMVDTARDERVVAVSPVGRAARSLTGTERAMRTMSGAHKRKPLESIAAGNSGWPEWARSAAECVRVAPSAVNRQPWRLRLEDRALVISRDSAIETPKVTKSLDCGIAMLHAELGAFAAGTPGSWGAGLSGLDVAVFTPQGG